jgi:hypothetical protein
MLSVLVKQIGAQAINLPTIFVSCATRLDQGDGPVEQIHVFEDLFESTGALAQPGLGFRIEKFPEGRSFHVN